MHYKLTMVWNDGKREEHYYKDRETAERTATNLKMAFGDQIWVGVDSVVTWECFI